MQGVLAPNLNQTDIMRYILLLVTGLDTWALWVHCLFTYHTTLQQMNVHSEQSIDYVHSQSDWLTMIISQQYCNILIISQKYSNILKKIQKKK
mgnify:CR=1 FL=1